MEINISWTFILIVQIILIGLKIFGYVAWSWFWILSPILITGIFMVSVIIVILIAFIIIWMGS